MPHSKILQRAAIAIIAVLSCAGVCSADIAVAEAEAKAAIVVQHQPEYSPMARQLKVTGKVVLAVTIGETGAVEDVKVTSGNPLLSKSCVKAVGEWKFRPFLVAGKATRATAPLTFEFK